jgi:hypothetical protein
MISVDLVMPSFGGRVNWDYSAALLTLPKAFAILSSWRTFKKTPMGAIARLE